MTKKDDPTRPTIETITPLTAPALKSNRSGRHNPDRRNWLLIVALLGSLVLLVGGGVWLLSYLSKNPLPTATVTGTVPPAPVADKKKSAQSPRQQPIAEVAPDQLARDKETAEQKLADFLTARKNIEDSGVAQWQDPSYSEMIKFGQAADSAFINKDYTAAAEQYVQAASLAQDLDGRRGEVLIRLLDEGQAALDAGNGPLAQRKFATALMIDSTSQTARRGLDRAKTIDAVTALIASGKQHDADGDLPLAAEDYQRALQLDADSREARSALISVTGRIKEAQFKLLLSDGLAALRANDYQLARNKLIKAGALKPNSGEVLDALAQVDQASRLARIAELQKQALAAEQIEDWQGAFESYQAVLDIDANVQFASRGKGRAAEQIRIAKRIDFFLAQPDTLDSDSQLENAILLITEAGRVEPQGAQLAARIKNLERLVRIAKTPVKITITSDNLTQVAVYRVGKLGRFEVYELELRPGTYTVVGAREGYQDVRQEMVVKPGPQPIRVTVKCRVKI